MGVVRRPGNTATQNRTAPSAADYVNDEDDTTFEVEDENESPDRSSIVQSGWDAARKASASSGEFVQDFKFTEDVQLVKFMAGEPIAVYKQHWVQERSGRKSFTCLGDKCPLCRKAGHKPQQKYGFSIVNLSADEPTPQLMAVGIRAQKQLDALNEGRTGPLDKGYWGVSRTGTGNQTTFAFVPVKERDLAEDWDMDAESVVEALDEVTPVDDSAIRIDSLSELNDVAAELT